MTGRLVIMGSGETSPTMVKLHRVLMAGPGPHALLDTPFGFQANADDLTEKIAGYFAESVGVQVAVARWRRRDEPVAIRERTLALLGRARWAFAGPGSPSYALRQWDGTPVPDALTALASRGGTVVMASAAAVTAGSHAVPVYEIYKVGDEPAWLPGLDLLGRLTGIPAAVIPHYDNREGGRHDTRYCYLGEQRLTAMEAMLPPGVGVVGVDEHTAVVIDLGTATVTVHGAGGLTLRSGGVSEVVPAGESAALADVAAIVAGSTHGHVSTVHVAGAAPAAGSPVAASDGGPTEAAARDGRAADPSLHSAVDRLQDAFDAALAAGDADGALAAALELEDTIHEWSADTGLNADLDLARRALRSMIVELAGAAVRGLASARDVVGPYVEVALDVRRRAREQRDFATSDVIRDGLAAAGVEVRDTPDGMVWDLRS